MISALRSWPRACEKLPLYLIRSGGFWMSGCDLNGLNLRKVSTPIGVVVIIYESRPNVTADAAGLCFKAGNAVILRGGKEAMNSNQTIAASWWNQP